MKKCLCILVCLLMSLMTITAVAAPQDTLENLDVVITVGTTDSGNVKVALHDDRGCEMPYWYVSLYVNGERLQKLTTDDDAVAEFDYAVPADATEAYVVADSGQVGDYWMVGSTTYIVGGSSATPSSEQQTTTSTTVTTTTTKVPAATTTTNAGAAPSTPSQSAGTVATMGGELIISSMTTTLNGNRVAIGIDIDDNLVNAFGMTSNEILARACMWMDNDDYLTLAPLETATLHLEMVYDDESTSKWEWFLNAKNASQRYASYADEQVKGFAVNMDLVYIDGTTRLPLENLKESLGDFRCDVQIPVPEALSGCKELAIAVCTANGLSELQPVVPTDGVILLKLQAFQRIALVGFGTQSAATLNSPYAFLNSLGDIPLPILLIFILGVLLVIGGIVLIIVVIVRSKKRKAEEDDEDDDIDSTGSAKLSLDDEAPVTVGHEFVPFKPAPRVKQSAPSVVAAPKTNKEPQIVAPITQDVDDPAPVKPAVAEPKPAQKPQSPKVPEKSAVPLTVDDVLDEVMSDLEDLDS